MCDVILIRTKVRLLVIFARINTVFKVRQVVIFTKTNTHVKGKNS